MEAQGAVEAHGIVEGFDVVEDHGAGLGSCGRDGGAEAFGFQGGPEGLHGGVVVAVGSAAHARGDAAQFQASAEVCAGILAAAIAVMKQSAGA